MKAKKRAKSEGPSLLDVVALLTDLPAEGLARGQVGTIVEELDNRISLVEFSDDGAVRMRSLPARGRNSGPALYPGSGLIDFERERGNGTSWELAQRTGCQVHARGTGGHANVGGPAGLCDRYAVHDQRRILDRGTFVAHDKPRAFEHRDASRRRLPARWKGRNADPKCGAYGISRKAHRDPCRFRPLPKCEVLRYDKSSRVRCEGTPSGRKEGTHRTSCGSLLLFGIFQSDSAPRTQAFARLFNSTQKARIVFKTIFEPVFFQIRIRSAPRPACRGA